MKPGKTIYQDKLIKVSEGKVELPNGESFERVFVETGNKVIIIPISPDGKLILGNFFSPITNSQTLRFPRGSINQGETPEMAAKRELLEETGFEAHKIEVIKPSYYPNPAWNTETWQIAVARDLTEKSIEKDKLEDLGVIYLSPVELKQKILSGEVFDASTIVAFCVFNNLH